MKYDFTTVMDRLGKDAIAVDIPHSGNGGDFSPMPGSGTVSASFPCGLQI